MSTPHGKTGALETAESQFFRLRDAQRVGRFTHQIPLAITGINCSLAGPVRYACSALMAPGTNFSTSRFNSALVVTPAITS